jgi:hypothetical protein
LLTRLPDAACNLGLDLDFSLDLELLAERGLGERRTCLLTARVRHVWPNSLGERLLSHSRQGILDFSEQLLRFLWSPIRWLDRLPAASCGPEGRAMILLMAGLTVFALIMGALSLVTAPVALALTALIGGWLLLFAARTVLSNSSFFRKGVRRG